MKCVGILLLQLLITATGFWYVFHNPQKPAQIAEALRYASMSWGHLAGLVTVWLKSLPPCAGRLFLATPFARLRSFLRRRRTRLCRASGRCTLRVSREHFLRRRPTALWFQRAFRCTGTFPGRLSPATGATLRQVTFRLAFRSRFAPFRWRQLYSRPPCLGQADGDRLLRRSSAMFALSDVFHFLTHKLACLRRRRFPFAFVVTRPFHCLFFRHSKIVSPLVMCLDVMKNA